MELFAQPLGFKPFAILDCVQRRDLSSGQLLVPERPLMHRRAH